ncbi:Tim44 domain-containing protein [Desulfovibrio psychrotolerans]|uniref:Transport protein n=1 Tax=Desulfovibrio psychrotolerans TaxID=415242 RepID=A0A7J0BRJ0_9BACT|nr:Tim44-like domain-containing protein [Desulfovibrio psychrotolerans]GFM36333.1 transport protein [Desulfovibrio psychrotolerans]
MNRRLVSVFIIFFMTLGAFALMHDTADARKMGGGKSFGSKPSYQRSTQQPAQSPTSPARTQNTNEQARQGQQAQQGAAAPPMGARSGFGGMLGGMLMGGLIGSMLFGGGAGLGGPGMLDMLLIGGGLFLLFRFLRARRMAAEGAGPQAGGAQTHERAANAWGNLSTASEPAYGPDLPAGFDPDEFLQGAKAIYVRLQSSWDKRDIDDIRQFTSDEVYEEIARQATEDPTPGKTELLLITPQLIEAREVGQQIIATVLYDVMLREDGDTHSRQDRELWHFSRDRDRPEDFWVLEGIQQIER